MKVLKQTLGFALYALVLKALWAFLRIDILEDLNLFADLRYWPWFVGAVILHALLASLAARLRRPLIRNAWVFGILALALATGLIVPQMIDGDGLAVGMFQFLNGYWVLCIAVYFVINRLWAGRLKRR